MNSTADRELRNALILVWTSRFNTSLAARLMLAAGSATAVTDAAGDLRDLLPGCPQRLIDGMKDTSAAQRKADEEMEFGVRNSVKTLLITSEGYPRRLAQCEDAPPLLFVRGTACLDAPRVVSIVGTRRCTPYGQDCVSRLVRELSDAAGGALIVSGLAYGIDICAHRAALSAGLDTAAVLAHGLDNLYPPAHRETAESMLRQGALVTEFFTKTNPDRMNFLRRNRIVAGLADATVVAESAYKGGALATARIAASYNRDVFAFPGRVGDAASEGCNNLIRDNRAALITSAADLSAAMMWQEQPRAELMRRRGIERTLFPELTADEQTIVSLLSEDNDQQVNTLTVRSGMTPGQLASLLFSLEMKGVVRCLAGAVYHLNG